MNNNKIIISEYCDKCHIEPSFILMLEEDGLIDILEVGNQKYIRETQLPELERYTRLYYDLSINIEGIDAIRHLLGRVRSMEDEIFRLRQELNFYKISPYEELL